MAVLQSRQRHVLREVIAPDAGNVQQWTAHSTPDHHPPRTRRRRANQRRGDVCPRCEYFPELAMAEESPGKAYDGLMAMIEKVWAVKMEQ